MDLEIKEENRKEFEIHGGFSQDTISQKYDELCRNYEEVYNTVGWPDPSKCAEFLISLGFTADSEVLDMGCGTGLVGKYLKEKSGAETVKIIGVDASDGMIEKCLSKGIYTEVRNFMLCSPDNFTANQADLVERFDFVTASGLLAEGHATPAVFDEMILSLKKGGYAIFTSRTEYMEPLKYQEGIDQRVAEGKWEFVDSVTYEKYSNAKDCPLGRFKPVPTICLIYRKL
jgi:predicted TPR repeat methyltransferase